MLNKVVLNFWSVHRCGHSNKNFIWLFLPLFQSFPPILKGAELMNHLFSMTTGDNSPLKALQKSGKNQDVARMAGSISSVLNQQAKLTNGQKV